MKKILIFIISLYQVFINTILKNLFGVKKFCRFNPSCSEYIKLKIKQKGVVKGVALGAGRLCKCHPF